MEDRINAHLYLELADAEAHAYGKERAHEVLGLPGMVGAPKPAAQPAAGPGTQ